MNYETLEKALTAIRDHWPDAAPATGLVLGSGWSDVAEAFDITGILNYEDIPGLGKPGVEGHSGRLVYGNHAGVETLIFQGRRHWYEGEGWTPIALPIYVLKKMGVANVILTNAAGGIRNDLEPGDLMVLVDHINMISDHPLIGEHNEIWGQRFPDQTHVYDPNLRNMLDRAGADTKTALKHGVYLANSGPTYETPAEVRAWRQIGADAVGMSTVPEAMLANAAGMRVSGISCITNYAAGILDQPLSHEEVTQATNAAMPRMKSLLLKFWELLAAHK